MKLVVNIFWGIVWVCVGVAIERYLLTNSNVDYKEKVPEWKQIDKPVKIVVQKNGRWYQGTEQDVINNQK